MNDVLQPQGQGYLVCDIDAGGYIRASKGRKMVHRETRDMGEWPGCWSFLASAKEILDPNDPEALILELTPDGGGYQVWVYPEAVELVSQRLKIWAGCYGKWPVSTLTRR